MVSSVIKVCPKAEELSVVRVNIPCPVDGCSSVLPHAGSLSIHLSKTHRIIENSNGTTSEEKTDADQNAVKQYHCPVQNCVYNVLSKRHFTSKKLLKQHYMKLHADKKHKCAKCGQGFGLERDCRRHQLTCGMIFRCKTCDCPFSSIEATINHCNIKQHEIPEECRNLRSSKLPSSAPAQTILILQATPPNPSPSPSIQSNSNLGSLLLRPLLPKPTINATILPAVKTIQTSEIATPNQLLTVPFEKSTSAASVASRSISIQTDRDMAAKNHMTLTSSASLEPMMPYLHNPSHQKPKYCRNIAQTDCTFFANAGRKVNKRLSKNPNYSLQKFTSSTGIQTAVSVPPVKKKSHHNMVGTQTVGDYILTTAMSTAQIPIQRISQGSQVSKQRAQKNYTMESSHTQTMEMQSPRWKKRRRASTTQQGDRDEIANPENAPNFLLLKTTGTTGEVTDNHTQTNLSNSAPAISTQTHMTCLMNSWANEKSASENCSTFSSQQSTETQTISSVLQHMMVKNVGSLYQMPSAYEQPPHPQTLSFSTLDSNDSTNDNTPCNNDIVGTKSLLEDNMESTMQTEPAICLIYSSLTPEPVPTSLASQESPNSYPSFAANLNQDVDDSNCTSLLNTLTSHRTNNNYECESTTLEPSVSQSQSPVSDPGKSKEIVNETSTKLPFRSFIGQNLKNAECSLTSFSSTNSRSSSFHGLESIASQEPEEKRKHTVHNSSNGNLLCSLVNKDPILSSNATFSDIGDSNDELNYAQMGPFDNERHFASTGTSPLDITDSSLLTFEKGIGTADNNGNTDSFLLQPSKAETDASKLDRQHSNINDIANKSFFHSLGNTTETHSQSSKVYMNSSMNTESNASSDHLYLNNSHASSASSRNKLFNNDKGVATDPCSSHYLGLPSSADMYTVSSNVLTGSPERRTISTCMDDLLDQSRLTLSNASCSSLISTQFAPLVADTEVQTLALDNDFEALLNNCEHSRSSSSVIDMYTQTVEDMLDLFGNTTETQTTVDDTFFPGLEFSDIETQTTAGELDCLENRSLITAGTQTTLSNQNLNRDVEFSDMETQTGFNVCDLDTFLTDSHTQTTFDELEDFLSGLNSQV